MVNLILLYLRGSPSRELYFYQPRKLQELMGQNINAITWSKATKLLRKSFNPMLDNYWKQGQKTNCFNQKI